MTFYERGALPAGRQADLSPQFAVIPRATKKGIHKTPSRYEAILGQPPGGALARKLCRYGNMARNCCWNCKYYIVRGDNEPSVLSSATSNVCVFSDDEDDDRTWEEKACPTPAGYVCMHYRERFY